MCSWFDDNFSHNIGWIKMKLNLLVLALMGAAIATPITTLAAETKSCKSTVANPCPASYADPDRTYSSEVVDSASLYNSIQWIGTAAQCTKSSSYTCSIDFTKTSTGTTTWKVGIKVVATVLFAGTGSLSTEANGEFGKTRTDTDTVGQTKKVTGGYTTVPYSYVPRKQYYRNFYGVWQKGAKYGCGAFNAYSCYNYTWEPKTQSLVLAYYRSLEDFQTITFKTFKNGSSSGLKLEDDN